MDATSDNSWCAESAMTGREFRSAGAALVTVIVWSR